MTSIVDLLGAVAAAFETSTDVICGPSRTADACRARYAAMLVLRRRRPDLSNAAIGRVLGGRDHTTIGAGLRRAAGLLTTDAAFAQQVAPLIGRATTAPAAEPRRQPAWATWWYWQAYAGSGVARAA